MVHEGHPSTGAQARGGARQGLRPGLRPRTPARAHLDALIAGIAVARGATLVSRDKDFARAPGIKLENWT
jgi:predicted nucleic acid-binding protein